MQLKRYLFILAASAALIFYSCSDAPRDFNSNLLGPDQINLHSVDSFTGAFPQSSNSFKTIIPTGSSNTLLIGKYGSQEASTLIQFAFYLPDSIKTDLLNNSVTITDGWVDLVRTYIFGDSLAPYDFAAYKITKPWSSIGFTSDSLNSTDFAYDNADISSNRNASLDSINSFHLTTQYLTDALKSYANGTPEYGIYIKPSSGSMKVVGYQAVLAGSFSQPSLKIVINKPGVYTDTLGFDGYGDVSVLDGNLPAVGPDDIVVQSSLVGQSTIAFDVSSIPQDAIINKADLILTMDTLKTKGGSNFYAAVSVFNIADSSATLIDSSFASTSLTQQDDTTFQGSITGYVQKWVSKRQNQGIIISPQEGLSGMEIFAFKGSNAAKPWQRPLLKILYTLKK